MIDVFIRTSRESWQKQPLRLAMSNLTEERWSLEKGVRVLWIADMGIREGREYAEKCADSDPYIVTDNDVLIVGKDWVKRAVKAILAHPEYAAVSSLSLVEGENQATCPPELDQPNIDKYTGVPSIYPMHAVGAPMIIRKGTMVDLPEMDINSECGVIHKMILDRGRKEGLVNGLRHNHMGHGFSGNPALFWGY